MHSPSFSLLASQLASMASLFVRFDLCNGTLALTTVNFEETLTSKSTALLQSTLRRVDAGWRKTPLRIASVGSSSRARARTRVLGDGVPNSDEVKSMFVPTCVCICVESSSVSVSAIFSCWGFLLLVFCVFVFFFILVSFLGRDADDAWHSHLRTVASEALLGRRGTIALGLV